MMHYLILFTLFFAVFWLSKEFIKEIKRPGQINNAILRDAKNKNLYPIKIGHPKISDWINNPFETKYKIGRTPFNGFPINKEYYRILIVDNDLHGAVWWIRVSKKWNSRKLEFEWKMQLTNETIDSQTHV